MTGDIRHDLYFRNSFVCNPHNNLVKQVPCPCSRLHTRKLRSRLLKKLVYSKGAEIPMKTHTITESEFVTIPI